MLMMQYIHRLPSNYEMAGIAKRAAALAPQWDEARGLGFKAFLAQNRGENGAVGNTYSSLYLWLDDEAATEFITDERFRKVIDGFGRPAIETWLPLDIQLGLADSARSVYREDVPIEPGEDLAGLKARESRHNTAALKRTESFAAITAIELSSWKLSRFLLSAKAAQRPDKGIAWDVLYLAKPGVPVLSAAA